MLFKNSMLFINDKASIFFICNYSAGAINFSKLAAVTVQQCSSSEFTLTFYFCNYCSIHEIQSAGQHLIASSTSASGYASSSTTSILPVSSFVLKTAGQTSTQPSHFEQIQVSISGIFTFLTSNYNQIFLPVLRAHQRANTQEPTVRSSKRRR